MSLKIRETHDCQKPSMVTDQIVTYRRTGFLGRKIEEIVTPIYENREAVFTCPDCGAVWDWMTNGREFHWWMCRSRPDKWVEK